MLRHWEWITHSLVTFFWRRHWPQFKASACSSSSAEIEGKANEEEVNQLSNPVHHHHHPHTYDRLFVCLSQCTLCQGLLQVVFFCTGFNFFLSLSIVFVFQAFVTENYVTAKDPFSNYVIATIKVNPSHSQLCPPLCKHRMINCFRDVSVVKYVVDSLGMWGIPDTVTGASI